MIAVQKINPPPRMTLDEFLDWADRQEGRYELIDGEVFAMGRESVQYARTKLAATLALSGAVKRAGLPCEAIIDGPGVTLLTHSYFVPDVIVACGERIDGAQSIVPNPVIVVEVTSPSTVGYDLEVKLAHYLAIPSIQHYLIVDTRNRCVVHHRRTRADEALTAIVRSGDITLDPPGLTFAVADCFGETEPV